MRAFAPPVACPAYGTETVTAAAPSTSWWVCDSCDVEWRDLEGTPCWACEQPGRRKGFK